jgi:hypothetical protein
MNIINRIIRRIKTEFVLYLPYTSRKKIIPGLIVSLTTYTDRIGSINLVIRSILHQTILPENIILWLGTDTNPEILPKKLLNLKKHGLIIKTGYEDIKPHKKYFFAMQEYPQKIIVTIDDDTIYEKHMLEDLYNSYKKYPDAISARRVTLMTKKSEHELNSYSDFIFEYEKTLEPSHALMAIGVGGVLYPPNALSKEAFNLEVIRNTCLRTDDIWLKFMEAKNNMKVVFVKSSLEKDLTVRKTQCTALMHSNIDHGNQNDLSIKALQETLNLNLADYI